jgi:hypothetical protein
MSGKDRRAEGHYKALQGFSVTSAEITFGKAWKAFNANDKTALGKCLSEGVLLCEIKDQKPIASGKHDVLQILTNGPHDTPKGLKGATFTPNNDLKASASKVKGTAYWHDNDGSADDPKVPYDFDFDDSSLIVKMYAEQS